MIKDVENKQFRQRKRRGQKKPCDFGKDVKPIIHARVKFPDSNMAQAAKSIQEDNPEVNDRVVKDQTKTGQVSKKASVLGKTGPEG